MQPNHRFGAAAAALEKPWLIAAAVTLATLAAAFFLFHPAPIKAAQAKGTVVSTAKSRLGRILVDSRGRTLYLFGKDRSGKSACAGKCASFWPPLIATGQTRSAGGAKASLIGTTRRADGRLQVTYKHHPLYRFVKDTAKGQTKGEDIDAFGGEWFAVSPAGAAVKKHSGGGGY
jgi:predicted lipoprotein with Yx(FWY)xxD motif